MHLMEQLFLRLKIFKNQLFEYFFQIISITHQLVKLHITIQQSNKNIIELLMKVLIFIFYSSINIIIGKYV